MGSTAVFVHNIYYAIQDASQPMCVRFAILALYLFSSSLDSVQKYYALSNVVYLAAVHFQYSYHSVEAVPSRPKSEEQVQLE